MPGADLLEDLTDDAARLVREVEDFLRSLPPGAAAPTLVPLLVPGAAAAGSVLLAVLLWITPDIDVSSAEAQRIRAAVEALQSNQAIGAAQLSRALAGVPDTLRVVASAYRQAEAAQPAAMQAPAPTTIARQGPSALAQTVALHEVWREGHHDAVHGRLAAAETGEAAAEVAAVGAIAPAITATVEAIRAIVQLRLPELRLELVRQLRAERDLRLEGDRELATELRTATHELRQRIGDVVRWLRTEVLPDIREEFRLQRAEYLEVSRQLRQRLALEEDTRTDADLALATGVAAAAAWIAGDGQHVARKVKSTEGVFDQLMRNDLNWAAQLLAAGPFVALASGILARVAGRIPETLGGLEEAAARALGEVF
jgi:hypothetical protein